MVGFISASFKIYMRMQNISLLEYRPVWLGCLLVSGTR